MLTSRGDEQYQSCVCYIDPFEVTLTEVTHIHYHTLVVFNLGFTL